jgi:hypothetical protein
MKARLFALALAVGVIAACGGNDAPATISGNYVGTVQDSNSGSGTARFTLAQAGSAVTGTWSVTYPAGTNGGTLAGTAGANSAAFVLTPSDASLCPYQATVTISGNRLTGTYAGINCVGTITGSIDASR